MFQRKSNFPQMPTPPTGEQQAKDMMKCTYNSDVVQALDLQGKYKHVYLQYFYFLTFQILLSHIV